MGTTVRNGVFETNSSSTHSVTVNNGNWQTICPNEENIIILYGRDFGWEWKKFNDSRTKAVYCAVSFKDNENRLENLKKIICDYTNANDVIFYIDDCYIDHQSVDTVYDLSDDEINSFIFSSDSWLYLGNDNSDNSDFYN